MSVREYRVGGYEIKVALRPLACTAGTVLLAGGAASAASCAFTGTVARETWMIVAVLVTAAAYGFWRLLLARRGTGSPGDVVMVEIRHSGTDEP